MNSQIKTYQYKGLHIIYYPLGKLDASTKYRFDVYDNEGLCFSYIKGIADVALVIAASNGVGTPVPGPETYEAMYLQGKQAVESLIDSERYQSYERGHVIVDVELA